MGASIEGQMSLLLWRIYISLICYNKGGIVMYHMNEKRIYPQNVLVTLIMAFVMGLVFNGIAYFTILDLEDA